jgi:hypothetical protein
MAVGGEIRTVEIAEGTSITPPTDVTVAVASQAMAVRWIPSTPAPVEEVDATTGALVQRFTDGGTEAMIGFVKVPEGYTAGAQIIAKVALYSPSTSNTIKLAASTSLIEKDTDALESVADQHASTNAALTNTSPARRYREASLDLTDGSGLINSVAVAAGDVLRVVLTRDSATDTDTADIRFVPDLTEVLFNA